MGHRIMRTVRKSRSRMMRQIALNGKALVTAIVLTAAVSLLWPGTSLAVPPTLGPDCGAGASIVGTDSVGKVTMGTGAGAGNTCTLTFESTWTNAPACMAMNETNSVGKGEPAPVGTKSTDSKVILNGKAGGVASLMDGDVVSYFCVSY
jgi:hypothetical protein